MDFMEQFKEYLVEWCHKHHMPVPKKEWSEHWQLAWKDFMQEVLMSKYEDVNTHYNSLNIVVPHTESAIENSIDIPLNEVLQNDQTDTKEEKSDWEIVQELMRKKK